MLDEFKWLAKYGVNITSIKIELEGKPVYLFAATDGIKDPIEFEEFKLPVTKIEKKAYVLEDGQTIQYDVIYTFDNGSTLLTGQSSHLWLNGA